MYPVSLSACRASCRRSRGEAKTDVSAEVRTLPVSSEPGSMQMEQNNGADPTDEGPSVHGWMQDDPDITVPSMSSSITHSSVAQRSANMCGLTARERVNWY